MEVEFLSNMRYSLLASASEWDEWQKKLSRFGAYCEQASRIPTLTQASSPALPNPYGMANSPYTTVQSPWASTNNPSALPSPISGMTEHAGLKRSYTGNVDEPPPKRLSRANSSSTMSYTSVPAAPRRDGPRLPVPNLVIATSQPSMHNYPPAPPVLPPLHGRAMATIYPSTPTHAHAPPRPLLTPTGPSNAHGPLSAGPYSAHGTPTRRQSPHALHDLMSFTSSPMSSTFPGHGSGQVSPSYYLQRSSPYRPVRHVNTLLYPPPSASLHDYSTNVQQMHYQPLGRRDVFRTGVVPEFVPHPYQQWPILPQPQFHQQQNEP